MHFSFPGVDAEVAFSQWVADDLGPFARLDRAAIHVVYNPVVGEARPFAEEPHEPEGWWSGPHRRVLALGALKPIKDYATLLSAFAGLRQRVDVRFVILGEGGCRAGAPGAHKTSQSGQLRVDARLRQGLGTLLLMFQL